MSQNHQSSAFKKSRETFWLGEEKQKAEKQLAKKQTKKNKKQKKSERKEKKTSRKAELFISYRWKSIYSYDKLVTEPTLAYC